jgi:cytoskeletal protein CcmA (bactofilin family)
MESASALSTYCRSCGGHVKIERPPAGGRRGLGALMGLARGKPPPGPPPKTPAARVQLPAVPLQIAGYGAQDTPLVARAESLAAPRPPGGTAGESRRVVMCFECQATHKVAIASASTICPGCSTCIDLRNVEINDRTNRRIRTRGDVVVLKKGALLGSSIHCGNLTVYGSVAGSIHAAGYIRLKSDGKFLGEVRCRRFILERKCEVQCLQPVYAEEVEIHGRAGGHFRASRCITLSRHASLTGSATAQSITVEPGAVLNGTVKVQSPDAAPARCHPLPGVAPGLAVAT